jgi:hypothetical protein
MSVWNVKAKIQKSRELKLIAAGLLMVAMAGIASPAQAQAHKPVRRETSSNRKLRIQRTIEDTYSHRWEIGGGGGYLRWRSGELLRRNNEVTFWMDGTYNVNRKLGIIGGVHGAYGNAKIGNTTFNLLDPQISEYTFMAGPTYRLYAQEQSSISVFAEGGSALGKFGGGTKGFNETDLGIWPSSNARPAFSAGINYDYNLYPNLAVRLTPLYLGTNFGGSIQNNFGLNVGVVYRFGRIH